MQVILTLTADITSTDIHNMKFTSKVVLPYVLLRWCIKANFY